MKQCWKKQRCSPFVLGFFHRNYHIMKIVTRPQWYSIEYMRAFYIRMHARDACIMMQFSKKRWIPNSLCWCETMTIFWGVPFMRLIKNWLRVYTQRQTTRIWSKFEVPCAKYALVYSQKKLFKHNKCWPSKSVGGPLCFILQWQAMNYFCLFSRFIRNVFSRGKLFKFMYGHGKVEN